MRSQRYLDCFELLVHFLSEPLRISLYNSSLSLFASWFFATAPKNIAGCLFLLKCGTKASEIYFQIETWIFLKEIFLRKEKNLFLFSKLDILKTLDGKNPELSPLKFWGLRVRPFEGCYCLCCRSKTGDWWFCKSIWNEQMVISWKSFR